jgi:hypothetical protein
MDYGDIATSFYTSTQDGRERSVMWQCENNGCSLEFICHFSASELQMLNKNCGFQV